LSASEDLAPTDARLFEIGLLPIVHSDLLSGPNVARGDEVAKVANANIRSARRDRVVVVLAELCRLPVHAVPPVTESEATAASNRHARDDAVPLDVTRSNDEHGVRLSDRQIARSPECQRMPVTGWRIADSGQRLC